ncbi:hypothetical protein CHS0354_037184 [Potamilus streckersoni]|uniref:Uncharacterized protein n=1 Tax=Potamilus streckersoni TaxID=2493646 RepID=A0AAE0SX86_9BIVA|nr:hypothetical protein CHS0354_037184 [Potamilus streckersoni]
MIVILTRSEMLIKAERTLQLDELRDSALELCGNHGILEENKKKKKPNSINPAQHLYILYVVSF